MPGPESGGGDEHCARAGRGLACGMGGYLGHGVAGATLPCNAPHSPSCRARSQAADSDTAHAWGGVSRAGWGGYLGHGVGDTTLALSLRRAALSHLQGPELCGRDGARAG